MTEPLNDSSPLDNFQRYLSSKKSVDDRALNGHVWQDLQSVLDGSQSDLALSKGAVQPLRILEVGAGIGTMIERLVSHGMLRKATYLAIDSEEANVSHAVRRLSAWAEQYGYTAQIDSTAKGQATLDIAGDSLHLMIEFRTQDVLALIADPAEAGQYDLLIAHAFLDLLDVERVLPQMARLLTKEGIGYFTINFDGATILQPEIDAAYDAEIEAIYHATMDERVIDGKPSGDSQTGRHLFGHLRKAGYEILQAGSSDWVVFAYPEKDSGEPGSTKYRNDEAYFLHFIINTMHGALIHHPQIDAQRFSRWIAQRHTQIERGELVYLAHQLDFLVQRGRGATP